MRVVTVPEMIEIEKKANNQGLSYKQMMRNAGNSIANVVIRRYSSLRQKTVLGLVGSGNNGGDTLIALTMMQKSGWQTKALIVKERPAEDPLLTDLVKNGGEVITWNQEADEEKLIFDLRNTKVLLDGILGTGFKLPLRGPIPPLLSLVRKYAGCIHVIAVDCPSGVDCDSGECAPETLKAEITVCMAALKKGLLKPPAIGMVGEVIHGDIGLPASILNMAGDMVWAADSESVYALLPKRPFDAHKGTFGKCLIVGGSTQYPGAPLLAAKSAYRVGAGLVCTGVPAAIYDSLIGGLPESIWLMLPHELGFLNDNAARILFDHVAKYNTVLLGPGIGLEKETISFLDTFLDFDNRAGSGGGLGFTTNRHRISEDHASQPNLVIDADALRALAQIDNWHEKIEKPAVLTPHPGEMASLTGLSIKEIQESRMETAQRFADACGHIVVLKGAATVIAGPHNKSAITPIATPALATAGSGDILAGMITGLLTQGMDAYSAAVAASWMHGIAGLYSENRYGQSASTIASDIIEQIPNVLKNLTAC